MTTAAPLARYGAFEGPLASGFATVQLHRLAGHDPHHVMWKTNDHSAASPLESFHRCVLAGTPRG